MPRGKRVEPVLPKDPEIERTARQLRKAVKAAKVTKTIKGEGPSRSDNSNKMAARIPMRNHANPTATGINFGARGPGIDANSFELRYGTIQLVQQNQFGGAPTEDPHSHLRAFERICSTIKMNGVPDDSIRLRLFKGSSRHMGGEPPKRAIQDMERIGRSLLT